MTTLGIFIAGVCCGIIIGGVALIYAHFKDTKSLEEELNLVKEENHYLWENAVHLRMEVDKLRRVYRSEDNERK